MARAKDWIKFNLSVPCRWKYPDSANTLKNKSLNGNNFFCSFSGKNSFACMYSNGEYTMDVEKILRWSPLIWLQKGEVKKGKIFEEMKCYCGFLQAPTAKLHFDLINEAFKDKNVDRKNTKRSMTISWCLKIRDYKNHSDNLHTLTCFFYFSTTQDNSKS